LKLRYIIWPIIFHNSLARQLFIIKRCFHKLNLFPAFS